MLLAWLTITVLVGLSLAVIYFRNGEAGLQLFIQEWPLSNLAITLAATVLTWLSLGALLLLIDLGKINNQNALRYAGIFLLLFVYLNVLRERFRYGDYQYYLEAANSLLKNQPLPDTYIYLPLWATLVQFIAPLGDQGVLLVLWIFNILFFIGFYFLLTLNLQRYGFSPNLAVAITSLFMMINAPLQRTLGYVQVNLLVMDLIFLSLLLFTKRDFWSAASLALAIHLKTSPLILSVAFLFDRNWRWLAWFVLSFIGIGLIPIAIHGASPYMDFLTNISLLAQNTNTNFHDTSFDSFLRFLDPFLRIDPYWTRILIYISKLLLFVATFFTALKNLRNRTYLNDNKRGALMLNAMPSLFIFMTLASPIVWDHHGLFVALPFLLLIKRLESPAEWAWFSLAYFLQFILPSFDFFPWSFGKLFAPLIVLGLLWRTADRSRASRLFVTVEQWLAKRVPAGV